MISDASAARYAVGAGAPAGWRAMEQRGPSLSLHVQRLDYLDGT